MQMQHQSKTNEKRIKKEITKEIDLSKENWTVKILETEEEGHPV